MVALNVRTKCSFRIVYFFGLIWGMDEGVKLLGEPDTPSEESRVLAQEVED